MRKITLVLVCLLCLGILTQGTVGGEEKKGPGVRRVFGSIWRSFIFPERDIVCLPEKAIKLMGVKKGDVAVDIDPGPGYWTFKLAKAVGPTGKVIGLQMFEFDCPEMDAWLESALADKKLVPYNNVVFEKKFRGYVVPEGSADLVLLSLCALMVRDPGETASDGNVYSATPAFAAQEKILRSVYGMLKPGGRLVVIEMMDTPPLRKLVESNGGGSRQMFDIAAKDIETVVRNYESLGFRKIAEYPVYRGPGHRRNSEKAQRSGNFERISWQARVTFVSDQTFLVFEKPRK